MKNAKRDLEKKKIGGKVKESLGNGKIHILAILGENIEDKPIHH